MTTSPTAARPTTQGAAIEISPRIMLTQRFAPEATCQALNPTFGWEQPDTSST